MKVILKVILVILVIMANLVKNLNILIEFQRVKFLVINYPLVDY